MLVDLDFKRVGAEDAEMRRQIELGRQAAVFGIADVPAVHADAEGGRHAIEVKDRPTEPPAPWALEGCRVETDGIAVREGRPGLVRRLLRHARRIHLDRVAHVRVERRVIVALELPAARHADFRRLLPVGGGGRALPPEVPFAVQRQDPARFVTARLALGDRDRQLFRLARNGDRTRRQAVDRIDRGIFPRLGSTRRSTADGQRRGGQHLPHGQPFRIRFQNHFDLPHFLIDRHYTKTHLISPTRSLLGHAICGYGQGNQGALLQLSPDEIELVVEHRLEYIAFKPSPAARRKHLHT